MRQRDLAGDHLVIVGYVRGGVLAAVLELDSEPHPELFEVCVAGLPIDADPLSDRPSLLRCELPRGHVAPSIFAMLRFRTRYPDDCLGLRLVSAESARIAR